MPDTRDIRHNALKTNLPSVGNAPYGNVPPVPRIKFSPHRAPVLRSHSSISEEVEQLPGFAGLTEDQKVVWRRYVEDIYNQHQPWLEWSEKRELPTFAVDPVVLQTHERVSTKAILSVAETKRAQLSMFGSDELAPDQELNFYSHQVNWTNRLILGDSLQVMASLSARESEVAGQVQMIYLDPPYGIKFASNFQPQIGQRNVTEGRDADLTREPETVKAFRDTWRLGVHTYLTCLRDRLIVARELLHESGSIFVQISDENLHRVRCLMDEIFGSENFCSQIVYVTTSTQGTEILPVVNDNLLWYCKQQDKVKYHQLYEEKAFGGGGSSGYNLAQDVNGFINRIRTIEDASADAKIFSASDLTSSHQSLSEPVKVQGHIYASGHRFWSTSTLGMIRLRESDRIFVSGNTLRFKRYIDDFAVFPRTNIWMDTGVAGFTSDRKQYVVQTNSKVIERCILMTTAPGDLVLDPTCGSGTTAYVAEQWGRRWITIDTSRVALAIARQRLLTARFDHYKFKDETAGVSGGFRYKTVPHITLKSIAQNSHLDPVFEKHSPILDSALQLTNEALDEVRTDLRRCLKEKLARKQKDEGKKSITDADRRRWELPERFEHWTVPFDSDSDWPLSLQNAVTQYRRAWRAKMDEVNTLIKAHADSEELVDQPEIVKGVVRVSGPFTVEAVMPRAISLDEPSLFPEFDGAPDELGEGFTFNETHLQSSLETENPEAYISNLIRLLQTSGVTFPDNRELVFSRLQPARQPATSIHAEGRCYPKGGSDPNPDSIANVAVCFGPQYGSLSVSEIQDVRRFAINEGYEHVIFAGFSFDAAATAEIERKLGRARFETHMAHIRPDVNPTMGGLLKDSPRDQLFSVFGAPRVRVEKLPDNEFRVHMEGVDIYDPVKNEVTPARGDKVAAWFLDADYDDEVFSITQAFFPDRSAWDKLERSLKGTFAPDVWQTLSGTVSLPFVANGNRKIAVKVIDPRGNEVMKVVAL